MATLVIVCHVVVIHASRCHTHPHGSAHFGYPFEKLAALDVSERETELSAVAPIELVVVSVALKLL